MSLKNRLCLAVMIHSLGFSEAFDRIYNRLGMTQSEAFMHCMKARDGDKRKRKIHSERPEVKKRRTQKLHLKIKEETRKAKKDKERGFTYGSGCGLKDITEKKKTKSACAAKICPLKGCGRPGHLTNRSAKCFWKHYKGKTKTDMPALAEKIFPLIAASSEGGKMPAFAPLLDLKVQTPSNDAALI